MKRSQILKSYRQNFNEELKLWKWDIERLDYFRLSNIFHVLCVFNRYLEKIYNKKQNEPLVNGCLKELSAETKSMLSIHGYLIFGTPHSYAFNKKKYLNVFNEYHCIPPERPTDTLEP